MTQMDDAGERANALVAAWMIRDYLAERDADPHLKSCPEVTATVSGGDGYYGCETGCEYVRLEAEITCPHIGESVEHEYGSFDYMESILADLLAESEASL